MGKFIVFGDGIISGTLTRSISTKSLIIESSIDKTLYKSLPREEDYTLLQINNGKYQEIVRAVKGEDKVEYIRSDNSKLRFDHQKGTSIKFVNNVYVTIELLSINSDD